MRALIFAVLAAVAFAVPAAAQYRDSANAAMWLRGVCPGNREVLIATTSGERVRGYCGPVELAQLRVTRAERERTVAFREVETISVRQRGSGAGATTGALIGVLGLGGTGLLMAHSLCDGGDDCATGYLGLGVGGAAIGGTLGAVLGGVTGRVTQGWKQIYP